MRFASLALVGSHSANCNELSIIDSGVSTSMFKEKREAETGPYICISTETVHLAPEGSSASVLGEGSMQFGSVELSRSIHIDNLNSTSYSVGKICGAKRIVVFTANQGIILSMKAIIVDEDKVIVTANRSKSTGLYEFRYDLVFIN